MLQRSSSCRAIAAAAELTDGRCRSLPTGGVHRDARSDARSRATWNDGPRGPARRLGGTWHCGERRVRAGSRVENCSVRSMPHAGASLDVRNDRASRTEPWAAPPSEPGAPARRSSPRAKEPPCPHRISPASRRSNAPRRSRWRTIGSNWI
ncbi:hypothetical protein NSERUTF1_6076 [Nocardia seriolae]|nr:hypothetical protein NSERUTF1_6076 [Nocardia seriolae]